MPELRSQGRRFPNYVAW